MPLQQTSGNSTTDAYAGGVAVVPNYIEDVFSTWLYTGNGATQTITNGIDLSTKGGLTWIKRRSAATDHKLTDTVRGATKALISDTTDAQTTDTTGLTSFGSTGFTIGANTAYNTNAATYASWTFRKQPKFFDVVTYTGNSTNRTIAHSLGSTPGCILIKDTSGVNQWIVYHRSLANTDYLVLNSTVSTSTSATMWNSTTATNSVFSLGTNSNANYAGETYVAYLFAHNAGGFGLTGTDNVISCGSYVGNSNINGPTVTLGYEPQWILFKDASSSGNWYVQDVMRGMAYTLWSFLNPNLSNAENSSAQTYPPFVPTATGFKIGNSGAIYNSSGDTYIYIAIRRGPMKVPTDGTKVFSPNLESTSTNPQTLTTGFPVDLTFNGIIPSGNGIANANDRLRGGSTTVYAYLQTSLSAVESTGTGGGIGFDNNTGIVDSNDWNNSGAMYWNFRRAPGFFDEVCYTGTGSNTTQTHNLGVVPELIIVKGRSGATAWQIYSSALANTEYLVLNTTAAKATGATRWNSTTPTSSVFSLGTASEVNTSAATYVAYLFATCPGVSKVGSYTGNGTGQAIACGFAGGARFLLIKRTDSTGDWYVFDSANGLTSSSSPYTRWNLASTAQVTGNNGVYASTGGFTLGATATTTTNIATATYIFLAIA